MTLVKKCREFTVMVLLKQIYVHWNICAWFVVMPQLDQRTLCKLSLTGCQQSECQQLEKEQFRGQMNSLWDVEQQSGKQTNSLIRFECAVVTRPKWTLLAGLQWSDIGYPASVWSGAWMWCYSFLMLKSTKQIVRTNLSDFLSLLIAGSG